MTKPNIPLAQHNIQPISFDSTHIQPIHAVSSMMQLLNDQVQLLPKPKRIQHPLEPPGTMDEMFPLGTIPLQPGIGILGEFFEREFPSLPSVGVDAPARVVPGPTVGQVLVVAEVGAFLGEPGLGEDVEAAVARLCLRDGGATSLAVGRGVWARVGAGVLVNCGGCGRRGGMKIKKGEAGKEEKGYDGECDGEDDVVPAELIEFEGCGGKVIRRG